MKEFRNWTVFDFRGSNVLAWRSLPVVKTSCLSGSRQYTTSLAVAAHCAWRSAWSVHAVTPAWCRSGSIYDKPKRKWSTAHYTTRVVEYILSAEMRWFCDTLQSVIIRVDRVCHIAMQFYFEPDSSRTSWYRQRQTSCLTRKSHPLHFRSYNLSECCFANSRGTKTCVRRRRFDVASGDIHIDGRAIIHRWYLFSARRRHRRELSIKASIRPQEFGYV